LEEDGEVKKKKQLIQKRSSPIDSRVIYNQFLFFLSKTLKRVEEEVQKAQQKIIDIILNLEANAEIIIAKSG
jgi:hypothetical protein